MSDPDFGSRFERNDASFSLPLPQHDHMSPRRDPGEGHDPSVGVNAALLPQLRPGTDSRGTHVQSPFQHPDPWRGKACELDPELEDEDSDLGYLSGSEGPWLEDVSGSESEFEYDSDEEERLLRQEWEASVQQFQTIVQIIVLPYLGKFYGRRFGYYGVHDRPRVCVDGLYS